MKNLRYHPQLNTLTGSVTASLLMSQLEYWFHKTGHKPFYKFLAPCEDAHYQLGDSWVEELGFTKPEFRTAFSKIGKAYKTKTAYRESKDPFEGKLYLSYYDRIRKLTYYVRNHKLVDQLMGKFLENEDCALPSSEDYSSSKITHPPYSNLDLTSSSCYSTSLPLPEPTYAPTPCDTYAHPSTSELNPAPTGDASCALTPYDKIMALFHQCCPSLKPITKLNNTCKLKLDKLYHQLTQQGEQALAVLEKVFTSAESSDFLCGRGGKQHWKAAFGWIIRLDKFFAIREGRYNTYIPQAKGRSPQTTAFEAPMTPPTIRPRSHFMQMYTHDFDIKELEAREQAYLERRYGLY